MTGGGRIVLRSSFLDAHMRAPDERTLGEALRREGLRAPATAIRWPETARASTPKNAC